ncbi:MAG: hypothetical protein HGA45_11145 [Chloroflexales bacterium]|nr:hypothetical protein [Chloroflexales bacterium]
MTISLTLLGAGIVAGRQPEGEVMGTPIDKVTLFFDLRERIGRHGGLIAEQFAPRSLRSWPGAPSSKSGACSSALST